VELEVCHLSLYERYKAIQ